MKYMLLMYADPNETKAMAASDRDTIAHKHEALVARLTESGELLYGAGLDYPWNTTTIRWNHGDPISTDGPFTDAEEQLTAYYVVNCVSADRAFELAREIVDFHVTAVEVRPIHT
jgi:hypothetical protein